jgi:peptidoglycan/LPS O-acetylase OafA/YrhL
MVKNPDDKILQLQSLRFFAAFIVLVGHAFMEIRQQNLIALPAFLEPIPWGAGVDLFFVISGFIIYHIRPQGMYGLAVAGDFLIRRIIRIAPMYWVFTFLMVAATLFFGAHVENQWMSVGAVIKSLLFIPFIPEGHIVPRPVLGQGWTLNYEMFFYILFALTLFVREYRALLITVMLGTLVAIGTIFGKFDGVLNFPFEPILLEFVGGVILAANRHRLSRLSGPAAASIFVASLLWFLFCPQGDPYNGWLRLLERGIPSMLIVFATLQVRAPSALFTRGALPVLGDASYALYLSHTFVVNLLVIIWQKLGFDLPLLLIALTLVMPVAASVVLLWMLERPMLKSMTAAYQNASKGRPRYRKGKGAMAPAES